MMDKAELYAQGLKRCCRCKAIKPLDDFHKRSRNTDGKHEMCKVCSIAARMKYPRLEIGDYMKRADAELAAYKEKLVGMPTLTHEDWLATCKYFKRCALCQEEEITTKHYIIPFLEGGKYQKNNIIPLCTACSDKCKSVRNIFYFKYKRIRRSWQNKKYKENTNIIGVLAYLQEMKP